MHPQAQKDLQNLQDELVRLFIIEQDQIFEQVKIFNILIIYMFIYIYVCVCVLILKF